MKYLFLGNICRSPIAEAVFVDAVSKQGLSDQFEIDSAALGSWHVGRRPEHRAQDTMKKHKLPYSNTARQVQDASVNFTEQTLFKNQFSD